MGGMRLKACYHTFDVLIIIPLIILLIGGLFLRYPLTPLFRTAHLELHACDLLFLL
jgi:hypothetical protein